MLVSQRKVTTTVIERSKDVINLVEPYLPKWQAGFNDDYFEILPKLKRDGAKFDTIFLDLWREKKSRRHPEPPSVYRRAKELAMRLYPESTILLWGGWEDPLPVGSQLGEDDKREGTGEKRR